MKRIVPFFLLAVALAPASPASAQLVDCFVTCDTSLTCDSGQTCQTCTLQYDDDECISWREDLCSDYGLCGQCATVREWNEDTPTGNWQYVGSICYDRPFNNPDEPYEEYRQLVTRKRYRTKRCNGVETTELVSTTTYYRYCDRRIWPTRACYPYEPRYATLAPACSF